MYFIVPINTFNSSLCGIQYTIELCFHLDTPLLYGVQLNLDLSSLMGSWALCYNGTYASAMDSNNLDTILNSCNKTKLLLGCRPAGNKLLTVAAMGNRTDVLYNCSSTFSCTKVANGVGWYYSNSYSWGFVSGNDAVQRISCDTGTTNAAYRLYWHTQVNGGHRCGTKIINSDTTWEKIIYHAN